MQLLGLVPMHSDSQQFVRVAGWFETFTAVTGSKPSAHTDAMSLRKDAHHRAEADEAHYTQGILLILACKG